MIMQISVPNELVEMYESEASFRMELELFLDANSPCSICNGEGWITPEGEGERAQNDCHCPRCAGEKWEAPF